MSSSLMVHFTRASLRDLHPPTGHPLSDFTSFDGDIELRFLVGVAGRPILRSQSSMLFHETSVTVAFLRNLHPPVGPSDQSLIVRVFPYS